MTTAVRAPTRLRPAHYALLGLLAHGPAHGYDLQRAFIADGDLASVLRLEQPTLYATLKTLDDHGLIRGSEEREGARPPRTVYALTPEGEAALAAWLSTPVQRMREVRLDFLLKVYFARRRSRAAVRRLVDAQIAVCERYRAGLQGQTAGVEAGSFADLVAHSKRSAAEATLAWLREYRRHA